MAHFERGEEQLIERARSGDRGAQQTLWHAHRRWVAAVILVHRPRSVEVDDLMQETALKFITRLETLRDPRALRPWLRRIVVNICRGAARGQRPMLHLGEDARSDGDDAEVVRGPVAGSTDQAPGRIVAGRDAARRLLEQALTLPREYREPLLLRCVRSLTYQQIGDILEMPVTTVETRLARARRMLRKEVGEQIVPEELV